MTMRKLKPIEERDPYAALVLAAFDELENADEMEMEMEGPAARPDAHDCTPPAGAASAEGCTVLGFRRDIGGVGVGRRGADMAGHGVTMNKHNTYEQQKPTCPECGYALDDSDMNSDLRTH